MKTETDGRHDHYLRRVIAALVAQARHHGHRLSGLDQLTPDDVVEKHKRGHTLPVTPTHARHAKRFDPCECAIAHAAQSLPEVYAALVLRRYTYLLEKDERGKVKIFRYTSPREARALTLRFDKGLKTSRTVINFKPLTEGRTLEYQRRYARRWARGQTGNRTKRGAPVFTTYSFVRREGIPQED